MVSKKSLPEKIFDGFNYTFLAIIMLITLYPCLYVLFGSLSEPVEMYTGSKILLWPRGFNIESYKAVLSNKMILIGYQNTIIYVVLGTVLSIFLTISTAYVLSRKSLPFKNSILFFIVFTMYFQGGMIPKFMVIKNLNMLDTYFAMIIPLAVSTYNFIITLSYFRSLPESLEEAARIDGANHYTVLFKIMIPLAKPIIAVIALYYMVAKWNDFMSALLYLNNRTLYPLQLVLREILIQHDSSMVSSSDDVLLYTENVRYATIIVSTLPILCVYPFLQKYFVRGVMIGAIKG
jgi:putative aldouronate transport system permease protein